MDKPVLVIARNLLLMGGMLASLAACTIDQAETNRNASGPGLFSGYAIDQAVTNRNAAGPGPVSGTFEQGETNQHAANPDILPAHVDQGTYAQ